MLYSALNTSSVKIFAIDISFRLFWIGFPVCFEGVVWRVSASSSGLKKSSLDQIQRFSVVELDLESSRRIFFGHMFLALRPHTNKESISLDPFIDGRETRDHTRGFLVQFRLLILCSLAASNPMINFDLEIWRKDNIFHQVVMFFWLIYSWMDRKTSP